MGLKRKELYKFLTNKKILEGADFQNLYLYSYGPNSNKTNSYLELGKSEELVLRGVISNSSSMGIYLTTSTIKIGANLDSDTTPTDIFTTITAGIHEAISQNHTISFTPVSSKLKIKMDDFQIDLSCSDDPVYSIKGVVMNSDPVNFEFKDMGLSSISIESDKTINTEILKLDNTIITVDDAGKTNIQYSEGNSNIFGYSERSKENTNTLVYNNSEIEYNTNDKKYKLILSEVNEGEDIDIFRFTDTNKNTYLEEIEKGDVGFVFDSESNSVTVRFHEIEEKGE